MFNLILDIAGILLFFIVCFWLGNILYLFLDYKFDIYKKLDKFATWLVEKITRRKKVD